MIRAAVVSRHALHRKGIAAALFSAEIEVTGEADGLGANHGAFQDVADVVVVDVSVLAEQGPGVFGPDGLAAFSAAMRAAWQEPLRRLTLLSPREREVLELLGEGLSNHAIGARLDLAERTVKTHVGRVLTKLRVESRLQAGLVATAGRLISADVPAWAAPPTGGPRPVQGEPVSR